VPVVVSLPIVVVGSLNMDFVVRVDTLPERGQTVSGRGFAMLPGGKGANQACAAGRLGGRCRMVGRVGRDVFGERLRAGLAADGVDTADVISTDGEATGIALIPVEAGGQNLIVVAGGANLRLSPADVGELLEQAPRGILLLQLESPLDTVEAAVALGRRRGMTVVLDPAPARPLPRAVVGGVDILTPNESEALVLLGRRGSTVSAADAAEVGRQLLDLGAGTVILKLGANGAYLAGRPAGRHFPAPGVDAVDATAAGDTFNGALAVALAEGRALDDAVAFAVVAASISVTRAGAQASIPARGEVDGFLKHVP
jgi:ribokinase